MKLFDLINNRITIEPEILNIPPFKDIWDRDKSKTKETAYRELCYIYYISDYKSPYNAYPPDIREIEIKKDYLKDLEWKEDTLVKQAKKKYDELQESPTLRLLKSARLGCEKLEAYFVKMGPADPNYVRNLKEIGNIVKSLDILEEKVKKDKTGNEKIRGGGVKSSYEDR